MLGRTALRSLGSFLILPVLASPAVLGCSGDPQSAGGGGSSGGGAGGSGSGLPLANGTCSFAVAGATYGLPGYAEMNGGGNLRIECGSSDGQLELGVGNATFDGPGEYTFAPKKLDGGLLTFTTVDSVYDATAGTDFATGCVVDVNVSPVSQEPPTGSPIQGTFQCTSVPRYPFSNGERAEQSSGEFDFTNGAFNVTVR